MYSNISGPEGEVKKEVVGNIDTPFKESDDRSGGTVRKRFPVIDGEGDNDGQLEDSEKACLSYCFHASC